MTTRRKITAAQRVRLLELRQDGCSDQVISDEMGCLVYHVSSWLAEMAKMYNLPRRKITKRVVVGTDGKLRRCLRCQKDFLSEWYGNRRCHNCQGGSPLQEAYQLAAFDQ